MPAALRISPRSTPVAGVSTLRRPASDWPYEEVPRVSASEAATSVLPASLKSAQGRCEAPESEEPSSCATSSVVRDSKSAQGRSEPLENEEPSCATSSVVRDSESAQGRCEPLENEKPSSCAT